MSDDEFDFNTFEDDNGLEASSAPTRGSADPLEQWLEQNYTLWELGLDLAVKAQYYRREYEYLPFNKTGWYSPN